MIDYGVKINVGGNAATVMGQLFTISQKLDAIMQKLNVTSTKLGSTYRRTGTEAQQATQKAETGFKRVTRAIVDARDKLKSLNFGFNGFGSTLAGLGLSIGAADIARRVYNAGTSEENAYARLRFALGGDQAAKEMMARLKMMARNSTTPISEIYEKAGFLAPTFKNETDKYLRMFANVVAATGGDFGNIAFNFSQIKQLGRSQGIDLKQFAYQNIPIYQELAKVIGGTADQVIELSSQGKISFDMVRQAFENMTKEGGIYYGAVEARANTFQGKMQIIGNKLQEIFVKLFDKVKPYLDQFAKKLEDIIDNFDVWAEKLKFWGELAVKIGAVVLTVKALSTAISVAKIAMIAFTAVANLNPIILALSSASILTLGLSSNFGGLTDSINDSTEALNKMFESWKSMAFRIKLIVEGIEQAIKGNFAMSSTLFSTAFSELSSPDNRTANEYNRLKIAEANRIQKQIMQIYENELTGGGKIAVTKKRLDSYFKEQLGIIKANGLGDEYSNALQKVYDTYAIKKDINTINQVNGVISGSGNNESNGRSGFGRSVVFNITGPVVQIDSNNVDTRQYTAEQIGDIAAKEFVNIMSQIAVQ